ncbi:hypothetical protein [Aureimonas sp. AU40]|uniref:hypothetical protein n=1 Tax=Aureimonas sp. AU40 TaxID=1637747 RepID=UPI00078535F3|nr:hypothetical protein [Aureimonas sp. AU40]
MLTAAIMESLTFSASFGEVDLEPTFSPMLARPVSMDAVSFPVLASPKLDGIRCVIREGRAQTRENNDIPNAFIRAALVGLPDGLDGEIITYTAGQADCLEDIQSKVSSEDGQPEFVFHVFDDFAEPSTRADERHAGIAKRVAGRSCVAVVPSALVEDLATLEAFEAKSVDQDGFEGIMIRKPDGAYKFGRSTVRQGLLLKVKRFQDDEAEIVAVVQENDAARVGAFIVVWKGVRFKLAAGGSLDSRARAWKNRASLPGQRVTFRYRGLTTNGTPRNASFVCIRSDLF